MPFWLESCAITDSTHLMLDEYTYDYTRESVLLTEFSKYILLERNYNNGEEYIQLHLKDLNTKHLKGKTFTINFTEENNPKVTYQKEHN